MSTDETPLPLVGASAIMRALVARAEELARDVSRPVLLVGPRGLGKSWLAQHIHASSALAAQPLVRLDARRQDDAALVRALEAVPERGAILVQHVDHLSLASQLVLDARSRDAKRSLRVFATTAEDIVALVNAGRFSEGLYYRLHGWPMLLPALAERDRDDLLALARAVLQQTAEGDASLPVTPDAEATASLLRHAWPDNLRELEAVLVLAQLRSRGADTIPAAALAMPVDGHRPPAADAPMAEVEEWHLRRALERHGGNRTHAARSLGISRMTLISKLKPTGDDPAT